MFLIDSIDYCNNSTNKWLYDLRENLQIALELINAGANITIKDIDHINMHGTSTGLGDIAESKAIQKLFGEHAYNIQINSTKSMTGHLLGSAGIIEAISTIGAMNNSIVPPTINHFTDDENLDPKIDYTFNKPKERNVEYALSNTFGFGGHNACVIFKKYK